MSNLVQKRFTGGRALVADDDDMNRKILVEMLRQVGIGADTANNGREAVEMVRTQDYDILLLDIQMPDMDGIMATRAIRKLDKAGVDRLPILAMTADALAGDREKSLNAGMNDHLTKPVSRNTLGTALKQWLPREIFSGDTSSDLETTIKSEIPPCPMMPELDMEEGLRRLGGNRELYLKLLSDFTSRYGDVPAKLTQELQTNRQAEAARRVHAIRGVAGNLGGKELEAAAESLEKACRAAGSAVPVLLVESLRAFIAAHEALMMTIGVILAQQSAVSPVKLDCSPGTTAELRPLLIRLRKALESKEPYPCMEILEVLRQRRWHERHEVVIAELNRLIHRYLLTDAIALFDTEFTDILEKSKENNHE